MDDVGDIIVFIALIKGPIKKSLDFECKFTNRFLIVVHIDVHIKLIRVVIYINRSAVVLLSGCGNGFVTEKLSRQLITE